MGRIRTIKPEFPQSESMGNITRDARLCFILLWTVADDEGRLRGNSRMLANTLFPYDNDALTLIDKWLDELSAQQCIRRYEIDHRRCIEIVNWLKHQKIDKPSRSRLPCSPEYSANGIEHSTNHRRILDTDQGRDQGPRKGVKTPNGVLLGRVPPEELAGTLPLIDGSDYEITKTQISDWCAAYPAVNVKQQLLAYKEWLKANPTRRKTRRGIVRSVIYWLGREQDRSSMPPRAGPQPEMIEIRSRPMGDTRT